MSPKGMTAMEPSRLEAQRPAPMRDTESDLCSYLSSFLQWAVGDVFVSFLLMLLWNFLPAVVFVLVFYLFHFLSYANPFHSMTDRPFARLVLFISFLLAIASIVLNSISMSHVNNEIFSPLITTAKVVTFGLLF